MGSNNHGDQHGGHHVIPYSILINVMWALLALTVLTVVTAKFVHMGPFAALVAFTIAAVKAYLVLAYFMGLKYDTLQNRLIFSTGFIFLAILMFFCVVDIATRYGVQPTL